LLHFLDTFPSIRGDLAPPFAIRIGIVNYPENIRAIHVAWEIVYIDVSMLLQ
jgi:hypothetical protein